LIRTRKNSIGQTSNGFSYFVLGEETSTEKSSSCDDESQSEKIGHPLASGTENRIGFGCCSHCDRLIVQRRIDCDSQTESRICFGVSDSLLAFLERDETREVEAKGTGIGFFRVLLCHDEGVQGTANESYFCFSIVPRERAVTEDFGSCCVLSPQSLPPFVSAK
jgi:hypothetical protein